MSRRTLNRDLSLILSSYGLASTLSGTATLPVPYAGFPWMGFGAT